ncbi:redoxin domain-containing protein [Nonomuraea sp. B19D2]|uniref:TlpA family protein disulfide reductase n=1 Tax=Nonomuraea sp. B19D2 TaxID=3159561 RepID=UPI0032DB553D
MDSSQAALYLMSVISLVNLMLTLRLARQARVRQAAHDNLIGPKADELAVGAVAPPFVASTLTGQIVTEERFAGQAVGFIFVSPNCSGCRNFLPSLQELSAAARQSSGVELVLVSDVGPENTRSWLTSVQYEMGVTITAPLLLAPASLSRMFTDYDPSGYLPYFCLVNADSQVTARGVVGRAEWESVVADWHARQPLPTPHDMTTS